MLDALPPIPDAAARLLFSLLLLAAIGMCFWSLKIGAEAARKGEVKSVIGAPTIFGMPTTETVWRALKTRRMAGDREALTIRWLGWLIILSMLVLIVWPKAD